MNKIYKKFSRFLLIETLINPNVDIVKAQLELAPDDFELTYGNGRPLFFLTPINSEKKKSASIIELFLNWIQSKQRTINFFFPDSIEENSQSINLIQELYQRQCDVKQLYQALDLVNKDAFVNVDQAAIGEFLNDLGAEHEAEGNYEEKNNNYSLRFIITLFQHSLFKNNFFASRLVFALFSIDSDDKLNAEEYNEQLVELSYICHYLHNNVIPSQKIQFNTILMYPIFFSKDPLINYLSDDQKNSLDQGNHKEHINNLQTLWDSTLSNIESDVPAPKKSTTEVKVSGLSMLRNKECELGKRHKPENDFPTPESKR